MGSLLTNAKIGNTGVSNLIKSATTLSNQINTFKDAQAAQDYALSAKTGNDLASYQDYLNGRITTLSATGSITDATKAISMQNTLTGAIKANGSADIQRENIQIMAGNATLNDKYGAIVSQYSRAVGIGDMSLAQSLESQAYSVSQTIQYQAQQAADAAQTLANSQASKAKSAASASASGQQAVARDLGQKLTDLTREIQDPVSGGQKALNAALKTFVQNNQQEILTLNPGAAPELSKALKAGAQPNIFGIIQGVVEAQASAHLLAAQAEMPYNPDTAQGYIDAAKNLLQGQKISALGLDLSYNQIVQASQNPSMVSYNSSTQKYQLNPQTGTQFMPGKGVQPTYAPTAPNLSTQQIAQIGALHLNVKLNSSGGASDGIQVTVTDQSPQWIKNVLGSGSQVNLFNSPQGLQFAAPSVSGKGQATYTIISDSTGKHALAEESSNGSAILAGQYGFNPSSNIPHEAKGFLGRVLNGITGAASPALNIFGGHANAQELIAGGQQTQFQIAQANAAAAKAMLALAPPALPNISIAPPPPSPNISQPNRAPTPQINTRPVPSLQSLVTPTVSVQSPTVNPQRPSGVSLQGGSVRLQ